MSNERWWRLLLVELVLGGVVLLVVGGRHGFEPPAAAAAAPADPPANGIVVLLTDFGSDDLYVGVLKGAIQAACPSARIVDASHDVPNFDVYSAAYMLGRIAPVWPDGTTFVIVIDPGVGTSRLRLAVETLPDGKRYIAPDNGVLTDVLARADRVKIHSLENLKLARPGAESSTFHGRDWFGPIGGHLAGGTALEEVGPAVARIAGLRRVPPTVSEGVARGVVLYTDHYGNILTNLPSDQMAALGGAGRTHVRVDFERGASVVVPWVRTYAEVPEGQPLMTTDNGPGTAEFAINMRRATEAWEVQPGETVTIRPVAEEQP